MTPNMTSIHMTNGSTHMTYGSTQIENIHKNIDKCVYFDFLIKINFLKINQFNKN